MTDWVSIKGLRVPTRVGVGDEERAAEQVVVVDVAMRADLSRAAASDDLADTIDYGRTVADIAALVRGSETRLLEHLAQRIASAITALELVEEVTVEVAKEDPPILEDVERVSVRMTRAST